MPNVGSRYYAKKLVSEWYGKNAHGYDGNLEIPKFPKTLVYLGQLVSMEYLSDRAGGDLILYKHEWSDRNFLPALYGDPHRRLLLNYGNLDITPQGIISVKDFQTNIKLI